MAAQRLKDRDAGIDLTVRRHEASVSIATRVQAQTARYAKLRVGMEHEQKIPMSDDATEDSRLREATLANFPARRLDAARTALKESHRRLIRAAAKAGQQPPAAPSLVVTREGWASRCPECRCESNGVSGGSCLTRGCRGHLICQPIVDLTISWESPRLAGWEFLAVVEPMIGGNLIRRVPGTTVAEGELDAWRAGDLQCDHCETDRRRSETFVVRADGSDSTIPAGTHRQVGRSCLQAFLGGPGAATIVASIGWRDLVQSAADDGNDGGDESGGGRGWGDPHFESALFLSWVAASIRLGGWRSREAARATERTSTADHALYLLTPMFGSGKVEWARAREEYRPSDADRARGAQALAWARELTGASDYEQNLRLVAAQPAMARKHAGILASALQAHARHLGEEIKRLAKIATFGQPSRHVGTVGEKKRQFGRVTCERVSSYETNFGTQHVHSFRDEGGNALVWKTSDRHADEGGTIEMLVGTIKAHSEFRGEAQTEIVRCTLLSASDVEALQAKATPKRTRRAKATRACEACEDIGQTGLSYMEHTCDQESAAAPRDASDAIVG